MRPGRIIVDEVIEHSHIPIHSLQELLLAFLHPVLHARLLGGKFLINVELHIVLHLLLKLFESTPSLLQRVANELREFVLEFL